MNWNQLRTILWLRWRLTRNLWARSGGLGAVLAMLIAVGAIVLGAMAFIGGFVGGLIGLREAPVTGVMGAWVGVTIAFLFFWMIGLLTELQRSETIDLQRLMHLPVALGQIFTINYLASHLALSIVLMVPGMLGLALGLSISRGPLMLLLVPLAVSMVFMVTAWTYCLRGWLATLMTNPRRRRTIIMGITMGFILLGQGPNLYFNVMHRVGRKSGQNTNHTERRASERQARENMFTNLASAQKYIPPFWLPVGAKNLAENRPWPALGGMLGCFAIGALGLRRAYRTTVNYYRGDAGVKASARAEPTSISSQATAPGKRTGAMLELRLPGVPEQAAAVALASFRSLLRAPEVKMQWATSFIIPVIIAGSIFLGSAPKVPEAAKPFVATASVAFSLFMLIQFLANQFGFDRDGFRAFVLSPADRRHILLGKNLACLPVALFFGLALLSLLSWWLRLSVFSIIAAVFQLITMLVLSWLGGNLLSMFTPYRIAAGSMKPTKMPTGAMIAMVLCQMLFPTALSPAFLPPLAELLWLKADLPHGVPINLLLSIPLAVLAVFVYWRTLGSFGRLLQRRETKILSVVSVEVE